ncbi:nucleotidyltransferase domain-containing protein [Candidatus Peregrinibacteria bacterium]|nr:nucleotidyltransferase domain-containing protein [Candidatus Peregrinibacteria bacterium]
MDRNFRLARLLRQIAELLDEQGVAFKPAAYRKAAGAVEEYADEICAVKDEKELRKLPGIGEAIAGKIREFCDTGRIRRLDELIAQQGGLSPSLMEIEGLGPRRVRILQREKGIGTVAELIAAAKDGKLKELPGFSDMMEKKILENAGRAEERMKRFRLDEVRPDAERVLKAIGDMNGVERAAIAGSYRREKPTVGDIDILVVTNKPSDVSAAISKLPFVRDIVSQGEKKLSFNFESGLRVDVRFVKKDQWGSAFLYFTGDKDHNIALRKIAIGKGWKLSEYGLFEGKNAGRGEAPGKRSRMIAGKEEKDIYEKLGMKWIDPKERTGVVPDNLPF